ncbi:hypothetical protein EDD16DRAFT_1522358 [Pisolithus croceorrhizus]|nr:hypothetical protein EDD16DRAFT_1522358 [Pisolithus croceorrhizus]
MQLECITFKITVEREYSNIAAAGSTREVVVSPAVSASFCLILGLAIPMVYIPPFLHKLKLLDRDLPVLLKEYLSAGRDKAYPSKSALPKFRLYDILMAVVLMFLFVLAGLDIWSHFVVVHGA